MELITIRSFDNHIAAHLLCGRLEAAGIQCFLKDEHTIAANPLLSNAIGGVKVQVPASQQEAANTVLEALDTEYRNNAVCPRCGNKGLDYVYPQSAGNIFSAIATYLFGGFAMAAQQVYQCPRCHWQNASLPPAGGDDDELERAAMEGY